MSKISKVFEEYWRKKKNNDFRKILEEAGIKYLEFGQKMDVNGNDETQ